MRFTTCAFIALSTLAMAAAASAARDECHFHETKAAAVLGNSRVEIRLDPLSGVVTGLRNKTAGTEYLGSGPFEVFRLVYPTWERHGAPVDNPWSAATGSWRRGCGRPTCPGR